MNVPVSDLKPYDRYTKDGKEFEVSGKPITISQWTFVSAWEIGKIPCPAKARTVTPWGMDLGECQCASRKNVKQIQFPKGAFVILEFESE